MKKVHLVESGMKEPISADFIVRPYQPGDEKVINDRFNQIFGLQRDLKEWCWKFQSPNESQLLLAFDLKGKLVSHFGVLKENFTYNGKIYNAGHSVDNFSARIPAAIRQGIFHKLAQQFFDKHGNPEEFSLIYGFPGTRNLRLGIHKLDYGTPFPVRYWEKSLLELTSSNFELIKDNYNLQYKKIDKLWQKAAHRYPVSIVRDSSWIRKRYVSRPANNYRFLRTMYWGAYSSICVYTLQEDNLQVVDLIWDGRRKKDLEKLEELLTRSALKSQAIRLSMWLSGDPEAEKVFANKGWRQFQEPQDLHLVVLSFNKEIRKQKLLDHFYLTKGCTDII